MKDKFKDLNQTFNIDNKSDDDIVAVDNSQRNDFVDKNDIRKDYEYTRGNLYSIIEKVDNFR